MPADGAKLKWGYTRVSELAARPGGKFVATAEMPRKINEIYLNSRYKTMSDRVKQVSTPDQSMDEERQAERRKHHRYERADLLVTVARPGIAGFLRINPRGKCLNFCLAGLQFGSDQAFKPGDQVVLDLNVADIHLRELNGVVVKSLREDNGTWCTGIRFCFNDKRMQRPLVTRSLLQIEDKLRSAAIYPYSDSYCGSNA